MAAVDEPQPSLHRNALLVFLTSVGALGIGYVASIVVARALGDEARGLIGRAREGRLRPEEFQGGGFSISNMGMFGVKEFAAIINPPQAGILAISASDKRPVVRTKDGVDRIEIATVMTVTLSVDHRAVDGALAAQWVSVFKSVIEHPMSLVV